MHPWLKLHVTKSAISRGPENSGRFHLGFVQKWADMTGLRELTVPQASLNATFMSVTR